MSEFSRRSELRSKSWPDPLLLALQMRQINYSERESKNDEFGPLKIARLGWFWPLGLCCS